MNMKGKTEKENIEDVLKKFYLYVKNSFILFENFLKFPFSCDKVINNERSLVHLIS